mmetsp:Transcript_16183/g.18576  ORF Transcript_16183/g.18576 Transcript_16183/m.18576 type:complete len:304 (+) Transcript_16183:34-945(+)
MDIYRLSTDIKFVNQIAQTLNIDERMKLQIALQKINDSESIIPEDKLDQVLFWGRIEGTVKDYYIAVGLQLNVYEFPRKKFYWSSNDFVFKELPEINLEYKDKVDGFRAPFKGQHDDILIAVPEGDGQDAVAVDDNDQPKDVDPLAVTDEDLDIKKPPKAFTELDRLAYVVRSIDQDCTALPVGALKLTPTHQLRYNETFKGLSLTEAVKLQNYQHFKPAATEEKLEFISRGEAVFAYDFLDPLTSDLPKGCWSVHTDSSKTEITVRSLLWPGYLTYHRANSNIFGFAYFGDGIKNIDLPFLL